MADRNSAAARRGETQTPPTGHRKKEEINDTIVPSLLGIGLLRTPWVQHALLGGKAGCVHRVPVKSWDEDVS